MIYQLWKEYYANRNKDSSRRKYTMYTVYCIMYKTEQDKQKGNVP